MKKSKFTEAQIVFALHQAETGTKVGEVCRKMGISDATFYNWKKKYGGQYGTEYPRIPFKDVKDEITEALHEQSHLEAKSLLQRLQKKYPRRVKELRMEKVKLMTEEIGMILEPELC